MRYWLIRLIKQYQQISPFFKGQCRFIPTCSQYCILAIERFGIIKGLILTLKRLCKCHPGYKGDWFDMVPEMEEVKRRDER